MSGARLVVDVLPEPGSRVVISGEEAAHAHARRLSEGDPVVLIDGSGREAVGRLTGVSRQEIEVEIATVRMGAPEAQAPISLAVAAVRAERLSWVAEKATELGARRLTLVISERTQGFRASEALLPRLQRVVREAAKQAEQSRWPEIAGPVTLSHALAAETGGNRLILDPSGEPFPAALSSQPTVLLVGPEGGWSESELDGALSAGWITASLAAGKLRAETAAVAALALARQALARATRETPIPD